MRKTNLRRLEALEAAARAREERELSSLQDAIEYIQIIIFAYYLGDLKITEDVNGVFEATHKALRIISFHEFLELSDNNTIELYKRYDSAYQRLFAKVGLDFHASPATELFDAFVTMVDQLPDRWLNWLRSELQQWCSDLEIPAGATLPRQLSAHNFITLLRGEGSA